MSVLLAAGIAAGLAVGLARGGSLGAIPTARLHWVWLLVGGAALQGLALAGVAPDAGNGAVLVSYGALTAFAARNVARAGMGVVLAGILMNVVPIAANGGMPVEAKAIVAAGITSAGRVPLLSFGAKRHLAGPADRLRLLDDRIPERITREVLSFGDLVIIVGVGAVVAGLTRRRRRRPSGAAPSAGGTDRPASG